MDRKNQILLRITSNWPSLFSNIPKYVSFINNLLTSESRSKFFLEVVENGVIYVYSDFATFKHMNQRYSLKMINKYEESIGTAMDPIELLDDNLSPSSFPEGGFDYQFKFYLDPELRDEAIQIKKDHYYSYLQPNIEFKESKEFDLVIHYKNYEAVLVHHKVICMMLKGLLNVQK